MAFPDLDRIHPFFQTYIQHVVQPNALMALKEMGERFSMLMARVPEKKYDYAYADGKWTLKEVFQHVIDTERILCFRALSFARLEPSPLPGFEEDDYAVASNAAHRSWEEMREEFAVLRKSTLFLFASFDSAQLNRGGFANGNPLYVEGLAFIVAGHCEHHAKIIENRYL